MLTHHLDIIQSQNLSGLALEQAQDKVMGIYGHHLETEVEPFWDYLQAVRPKDTEKLDIPAESEVNSITDLKHSGLKRNTSSCDLNYEEIGMPLRPGMIYSVSSYVVYHE